MIDMGATILKRYEKRALHGFGEQTACGLAAASALQQARGQFAHSFSSMRERVLSRLYGAFCPHDANAQVPFVLAHHESPMIVSATVQNDTMLSVLRIS